MEKKLCQLCIECVVFGITSVWWWGENCVTCGHPLDPWRIICVWFRVQNKKSKTFGAFEDWLSLGTLTKNYCGRFVGCAKKHNWYWSGWEISKENRWMVANLSCKNFLRRGGQGERGYNWEQVLEKKKNQNCETFFYINNEINTSTSNK
jgi:hypothetical protein